MTRPERAVSVPINYTMSIMIVTILLTGLVISVGGQLELQQERTVHSEFGVLGNRLAADISATDQLAQTAAGTSGDVVELRTDLPQTVAGMSYRVEISSTEIVADEAYAVDIELFSRPTGVEAQVSLKTKTPVVASTLHGGAYTITYVDTTGDTIPDSLEVENV